MIGASTGGIDALIRVLQDFSKACPPTLIVQHTKEGFSESLSQVLNTNVPPTVKEADAFTTLVPGTVYIAPGASTHLVLDKTSHLRARLHSAPPSCGHRPSVDALFRSGVGHAKCISAAILTGMGRDGAEALLELRLAGARTIGQDKKTSTVYGMPRVAADIGALDMQLPIDKIGQALLAPRRRDANTPKSSSETSSYSNAVAEMRRHIEQSA